MKLPWRRLAFFALLLFIVPYMVVYSATKNDRPKPEQPGAQPDAPKIAEKEQEAAVKPDVVRNTGPFTYVTGHNKETYTLLYYPDRQVAGLAPVAKRISEYEPGLEEALMVLLDGNYAPPGLNKPAFMPGTRLLSVGVNGNTAIVDFNERLLPDNAGAKARMLIVQTIEHVARQFAYDKLELRINGKRLENLPEMAENPVSLTKRPADSYIVYRPLITEGLIYLFPVNVGGQPAPERIVNDFLQSLSKDVSDMYSKVYISPEVKLLSASVRDGLVTLNFNRGLQDKFGEFAKQFYNRQMAENFFFDSIIMSLTEVGGIREVRFMVDGKQVNSLNNPSVGNYTFGRPRNVNPVN